MKIINCNQGSAEWIAARLGIPTSSSFDHILTAGGKPSTQADAYMRKLLAEHFIGEPCDSGATQFMDRGTGMEKEARAWYEFERGVDVQQVGFCLRDDNMVGSSPDGLVGDFGCLELKTPSAATHVGYLLGGFDAYFTQCQGQLYVTGRKWVDRVAYSPVLPSVISRMERDEEYLEKLDAALGVFIERMIVARQRLVRLGCKPASRLLVPVTMVTEDPW